MRKAKLAIHIRYNIRLTRRRMYLSLFHRLHSGKVNSPIYVYVYIIKYVFFYICVFVNLLAATGRASNPREKYA